MRIIKPSVELMKHDTDIYSFIERVGRTCYKSEDKIADGSAEKFVLGLAFSGHFSPMEHEYLYFKFSDYNDVIHFLSNHLVPDSHSYGLTKYLNISEEYISGSIRAWIEFFEEVNNIAKKFVIGKGIYKQMYYQLSEVYPELFTNTEILSFDDEDNESVSIGEVKLISRKEFLNANAKDYVYYNLLPHTIKFVADRGFLAEITRHRPASFAAESTRYCCYANGKFNEEITVIEPCFWEKDSAHYLHWQKSCQEAEDTYIAMSKNNARAEEARSILPNSLKTEVVVTATEAEWQHIINLRYHGTTGRPHPQMLEVMEMAYPILVEESEGRIK